MDQENPTNLNAMSKSLTDQELRTQLQALDHGQLKNYLIQVVRQLEKYQEQELTEKEREILEKLIKEHQQEVKKLKSLIVKSSEKSQRIEVIQEVPVKNAIQQLPKKMLVLFGYAY